MLFLRMLSHLPRCWQRMWRFFILPNHETITCGTRDSWERSKTKFWVGRGYFRSIWTTVYQFWAHLIWAPKLGKPGKNLFSESKYRHFVWILFFFSIPQKCVTLIWNVRYINRSFNNFYSQTDLALETDRLKNPMIKHWNSIN